MKYEYNQFKDKFDDFKYKYSEELERLVNEHSNFKTNVRGVKIRGVFDTHGEAERRAKMLQKRDRSFHVFVGQMGYWLPWDPNADKVADEVFQDSQLNDMMEKYQENNVNRDMFYEEQKREKIKAAQEEVRKAKEEDAAKKALDEKDASEEYPIDEPIQEGTSIEDMEPEPEPEPDFEPEPEPEPVLITDAEPSPGGSVGSPKEPNIGFSPTSSKSPIDPRTSSVEENKKGSEVSAEIKESLDSDDPWMQRKKEQENQ